MAGFWRTAGTMTGTPTDLSTVPAAPVGVGRPPYPVSRFGWIAAGVAALGWLYAAVLGLFLLRASGHRSTLDDWVADWSALPIQLATLLLELGLLARRRGASDRWAWRCVVAFTALSPVATWVWNAIRPAAPAREQLGGPDLIYLMDYLALTAAFAVWFLQVGGSFRSRRTWFDGITMVVVLLVALWSSILGPSLANGTGAGISVAATFGYSVTLVCMMSMAALLCLQLPSLRGNVGLLLIVAAGLIDVAWEAHVAGELAHQSPLRRALLQLWRRAVLCRAVLRRGGNREEPAGLAPERGSGTSNPQLPARTGGPDGDRPGVGLGGIHPPNGRLDLGRAGGFVRIDAHHAPAKRARGAALPESRAGEATGRCTTHRARASLARSDRGDRCRRPRHVRESGGAGASRLIARGDSQLACRRCLRSGASFAAPPSARAGRIESRHAGRHRAAHRARSPRRGPTT